MGWMNSGPVLEAYVAWARRQQESRRLVTECRYCAFEPAGHRIPARCPKCNGSTFEQYRANPPIEPPPARSRRPARSGMESPAWRRRIIERWRAEALAKAG